MAEAQRRSQVVMTTDGAARGNPGPGGWAALLEVQRGAQTIEQLFTGEEPSTTTNNAMELQAVLGGLTALNRPCSVTLRLDSTYVLHGIQQVLAGNPLRPGMKHYELWVQLAAAMQPHTITCEWVKGHHGDARNARVDAAANQAAQRAYDVAEQQRSARQPAAEEQWTLALCSPGASRAARWKLHLPTESRTGEIHAVDKTEPTAVWEGLIHGLTAAHDVAHGMNIIVHVVTNYELIVKQGRGTAKVNNAAHKPLAAQLERLRSELGEVRFEFMKTEDVQRLVDES
jgi:ribonuclease HI